jgi:hypothetical protein
MRYELSDYEWTRFFNKINNVGVSQPDTTNSQPTIWPSSSSHQSELGCVLTSPCLSFILPADATDEILTAVSHRFLQLLIGRHVRHLLGHYLKANELSRPERG